MNRIPWERDWLRVSPVEFEQIVVEYLRGLEGRLEGFEVSHRTPLAGPDGEFEIDAVARFDALGASFVVLVECKHHRNPIKRELVQVFRDKIRSLSAHKGLLFSTAPFQKGAIEYAQSQGIALVHITQGGPIYETRWLGGAQGPSRDYDAHWVTLSEGGKRQYRIGGEHALSVMMFSDEAT